LVKDRLGQVLFSENTFLAYHDHGFHFEAGAVIEARFRFVMPILAAGHYSITAAIAEGTEIEHIQHHWIHDAIVFEAHTSTVCAGLVGVPMQEVMLEEISVPSQGSSS
jgi:lipopolysaccharide transport system ATP-binding protein